MRQASLVVTAITYTRRRAVPQRHRPYKAAIQGEPSLVSKLMQILLIGTIAAAANDISLSLSYSRGERVMGLSTFYVFGPLGMQYRMYEPYGLYYTFMLAEYCSLGAAPRLPQRNGGSGRLNVFEGTARTTRFAFETGKAAKGFAAAFSGGQSRVAVVARCPSGNLLLLASRRRSEQ